MKISKKNADRLVFAVMVLGLIGTVMAPTHSLAKPLGPTGLIPSINELKGVNFNDPILTARGDGWMFNVPTDYVTKSLTMLRDYGFNHIRVPYYWEHMLSTLMHSLRKLNLLQRQLIKMDFIFNLSQNSPIHHD